jgi:hypothetical protein
MTSIILFCVLGLQFLLIAASLGAPLLGYINHPLLHYLWAATGATTFLSAVSYAFMKVCCQVLKIFT